METEGAEFPFGRTNSHYLVPSASTLNLSSTSSNDLGSRSLNVRSDDLAQSTERKANEYEVEDRIDPCCRCRARCGSRARAARSSQAACLRYRGNRHFKPRRLRERVPTARSSESRYGSCRRKGGYHRRRAGEVAHYRAALRQYGSR